jgi:hypothetical protein
MFQGDGWNRGPEIEIVDIDDLDFPSLAPSPLDLLIAAEEVSNLADLMEAAHPLEYVRAAPQAPPFTWYPVTPGMLDAAIERAKRSERETATPSPGSVG